MSDQPGVRSNWALTSVLGFRGALAGKRNDPCWNPNDERGQKDGMSNDMTDIKAVLKHDAR